MAAIGARFVSRFEAILDSALAGIDLDRLVKGADLVITAEGAIDFQTPKGKVPAEVARRASNHGMPVVGLAGTLGQGAGAVHEIGIDAVASIVAVPMSLEDAVEEGESLLTDAAERMIRTLALGIVMADARRDDWWGRAPSALGRDCLAVVGKLVTVDVGADALVEVDVAVLVELVDGRFVVRVVVEVVAHGAILAGAPDRAGR